MLAANPHRKAAPDKMFVMAIRSLSVLFSFLILCQSSRADNNDTGTIKLPDGSRFKTTLYRLRVIGQLKTTQKLPYYILSAVRSATQIVQFISILQVTAP